MKHFKPAVINRTCSVNLDEENVVEVNYRWMCGESVVVHDLDGGGYPGSPSDVEILEVTLSGKPYILDSELPDGTYFQSDKVKEACFEDVHDYLQGRFDEDPPDREDW